MITFFSFHNHSFHLHIKQKLTTSFPPKNADKIKRKTKLVSAWSSSEEVGQLPSNEIVTNFVLVSPNNQLFLLIN